jgi:membrane protein required for colicin V production
MANWCRLEPNASWSGELHMTVFDYLVLFVLVCSIVISTLRGLMKEMLSLAGWIAAFVVANAYGEAMAKMLPHMIPGSLTRLIVAFVTLFVGVWFLMMLLTRAVEGLVKAGGFTLADRGLGGLFGLARGLVIVLTAVLLCGTTAIPLRPFWKEAVLSPLAEAAARTVKPFLPGDFARHVIHF